MLKELKSELKSLADSQKAKDSQWFFKTGKGEYGEGDVFHGITVPALRKVSKKYIKLLLKDIEKLLYSKYHEERLLSLYILVLQYSKGDESAKEEIYNFYYKHRSQVNNWDLVDSSAHKIMGDYLMERDRSILYKMAQSKDLWTKRISIITTYAFIKNNDFKDTIKISEILLKDEHDLIHKAVGWMLREVGKKDMKTEEAFLKKHYKKMPRTMLRYAIEKFPESKRAFYMKK